MHFRPKSFEENHPPKDYMKMSNQFLKLAAGLPLAIDVLGSFLYGRSIQEWELVLQNLKLVPTYEIHKMLQIIFDGLHIVEKEIFLHIACFFEGNDIDRVIEILDYLNLYPLIGLQVLMEKSLAKVSSSSQLCMPNLLQQMGREMVHQESPNKPGERSRLWAYEDIDDVLTKNMVRAYVELFMLSIDPILLLKKIYI